MRKFLLVLIMASGSICGYAQCTTTNATSCQCDSVGDTDCDLLPDITISWYALENYLSGPSEYSQTGNGVDNGRLKVTGSTPNIGHGPLTVRGQNNAGQRTFLCGTDTFQYPAAGTFVCPNGYPLPMQLTTQRIYHKNGNSMTYTDHYTGPMTYHPSHNHIHFDDWGVFTLRIEDPAEPDPRNWSIVGSGHKLGFCLMDYYQCSSSSANHHCKDTNTVYNDGTTMYNGDFPNWQLGGGNYGCSVVEQGISSGYTDVYSEQLDGMWINIPPGTCNGQYWIVYEVDPHDVIIEEDETNNYTAIPYTLTLQTPAGNPVTKIYPQGSPNVCTGDSVKLTATAGTAYLWNTGETTQSIWADPGTYTVTVTNYCGTATSVPFTVTGSVTPAAPACTSDTVCSGTSGTLTATGSNVYWLDSSGAIAGTGNTFNTPLLTSTTTYWALDEGNFTGAINNIGKLDSTSTGGYSNSANYCLFDVYRPLTIRSVQVYANGAGNRTIQLMDEIGIVVQATTFYLPNGPSRIPLNFPVMPGKNYSLRPSGSTYSLWRNTAGASYPYTMTDTLTITGNSAGGSNWYFFYDWEIEVGGATCSSPATAVTATVEICNSVAGLNLDRNINVFPNPSNGHFTLEVLMPAQGDVSYRVLDVSGRAIAQNKFTRIEGLLLHTIDMNEAAKGVYIMEILIDDRVYYRKIAIQ